MLLKALEIHGFKSFPDKTVLTFGRGITAVVGPNGSGKSNISDAIRWVLGEQSTKSLRGAKMEDVIFSGTAHRRGVGFAEVSLVIDNTARRLDFDADDVKVTRRYYRSGDSEYLLNNATVRLKDVQMLFMDTGLGRDGYSIIGQGRIGDIVASKSEERREIFEEAAGISKYRFRKNEAERRLKSTEENLLRLRDILQELEDRVGPLQQQAEKAKKYLNYAGEKKGLEIGLWLHTLEQSRDVLRELDSKLELARTQYDGAGEAIDAMEEEMEDLARAAQRLTVEMDEVRRGGRELEEEAARSDAQTAILQNDIAHNRETIRRIQEDIARSQEGGQTIDEEIRRKQEEIAEKQAAVRETESRRVALSEEMDGLARSSDEYSEKIDGLSRRAAALALRLSDIRVKSVTGESSLSEIARRLSQLTEDIARRSGENERIRRELAETEAALAACKERVEELQNMAGGYELRFQSRSAKLETAKAEADKLNLDAEERARRIRLLEELERSMEGFSGSVKAVIRQGERGALRGIRGPVSRLIQAGTTYALAIETALGAAAQNIVVDREEDAKRGIAYLKESKGGRATFLPISAVKGSRLNEKGLEEEPGFVGIAAELVECAPDYREIARSLLGRTAVAEDLDDAVAIAKKYGYRFRVVTLDGQVVNAGGSMTGGSHVKGAGLLSRRAEIDRLRGEQEKLTAQAEAARERFRQAQQEEAAARAALTGVQGELATAQEDRVRFEGEVRRLTEQWDAGGRELQAYQAETASLNARAEECRKASAQAEEEAAAVAEEQREVDAQMEALSGGRRELADRREELTARISELKLTALALEKESEAAQAAIVELEKRREDAAGLRLELEGQIAQREAAIGELEEKIAAESARAASLREQAGRVAGDIEALLARRAAGEERQTGLRQQVRQKTEERELAGREAARIEEKRASAQKEADDVVRRLYEEYELTRSEAEAQAAPIEDPAQAGRRLGELKNKIRALGSVNVDAIEEYKEVSERYGFLSAQVKDVEVSKDELLRLIGELTVQMREIFLERFKQINYYYGIVFTELFGGGKGELRLTDPDDILHSGIEMHVQPPGKVILNLDVLSGGEKAMAAIALLFAILKVTPSPFCVLDEIEAALDDVNVDRYAAYLRRMCDNTQFIVITHRRGSMEEADVLYGVTMQGQGVSKLLELRASEVEAKLGLSMNQA